MFRLLHNNFVDITTKSVLVAIFIGIVNTYLKWYFDLFIKKLKRAYKYSKFNQAK